MKRFFLVTLLLFLTFIITAHEFWLQPRKFIFHPGENVRVKFLVGENFEGENWSGNRQNIQKLRLYYNEVIDELEEYIADSTTGDSLDLQFFDEGTAMITLNSANKFIELEAQEFQAYLEEDGLEEAIEYRKKHLETDSAGKEFYQRSVKTILQIGSTRDETYKKDTELPIDIIPLSHPYMLEKNETLTVKVLFRNKPLAGAKVKVWHKLKGKTEKKEYATNESGTISFPVRTSGQWMVSTIKMIRIPDSESPVTPDSLKLNQSDSSRVKDSLPLKDPQNILEKAQWQSYWGSLTWGYTK